MQSVSHIQLYEYFPSRKMFDNHMIWLSNIFRERKYVALACMLNNRTNGINWGFSLPSTARTDLKLSHEFFIIQNNFHYIYIYIYWSIFGHIRTFKYTIYNYYLHHLHSVYTLFNSEAFDTCRPLQRWSVAICSTTFRNFRSDDTAACVSPRGF